MVYKMPKKSKKLNKRDLERLALESDELARKDGFAFFIRALGYRNRRLYSNINSEGNGDNSELRYRVYDLITGDFLEYSPKSLRSGGKKFNNPIHVMKTDHSKVIQYQGRGLKPEIKKLRKNFEY